MLKAPQHLLAAISWGVSTCLLTASAVAAPSAASIVPASTVGFVSIENTPDFLNRWDRTQIGRLSQDPTMRPFIEQIERRINGQFGGVEQRLGVTLEDFRAAASGEAAVAVIESSNKKQQGRVVALIDATGREAKADTLLAKIDQRLIERGGKKRMNGGLSVYDLPAEAKTKLPARTAAIFKQAGLVVAVEGESLGVAMMERIKAGGSGGSALADTEAYKATQARAQRAAAGGATSIAWFVAPFEYEAAMRKPLEKGELPSGEDTLAILAEQGFNAIKGIGGLIAVAATPDRDFIHHTYVYAPPKPGTEGKPAAEKYDLAMRMLDLPNNNAPLSADNPQVEDWAPRQVASYKTLHLDLQNAFNHLDTLFNAFTYDGAFETTITAWEKDYYGPKVRVRDEVVPYLGKRVVVMTDYTLPITPECERYLIAVDVTDENALRDPVNRWLKNEPGAVQLSLQGVEYWELGSEDEGVDLDDIDPLAPLDEPAPARGDRAERVLRRAAVCLHQGRLVMASDADFLRQALFGVSPGESLSNSPDLRETIAALSDIAPGERCAWTFARNDEALRPTYELIRQGKMPESQTFFGRLLNRMLTSEEDREVDALRPQKVDGSRLPSFELARRYFGPSARSVRSEDDGWLVSGVVLSKEPMFGAGVEVARRNQ